MIPSRQGASLKTSQKQINKFIRKEIKFTFAEKSKIGKETLIWLDDGNHTPVGVIVKKSRG